MSSIIELAVPAAALAGAGDFPASFAVYIAKPEGTPRGAVVLIHEVWGLVDHITDIADRWAAEGYLVAAPDILSAIGIEPLVGADLFAKRNSPDEKVRTDAQPELRNAFASLGTEGYPAWAVAALGAVVDHLEAQPGVDGRIAVTGFCFGGTYSFALAAADPRVRAVLPFYGTAPEDVSAIAAPVFAFYGEQDTSLIEKLPGLTARMNDAGVDFTAKVYANAGHAFFNDTNPHSYVPDSAADAWAIATTFLAERLG
jgi:carboxymethylenebutenolidase